MQLQLQSRTLRQSLSTMKLIGKFVDKNGTVSRSRCSLPNDRLTDLNRAMSTSDPRMMKICGIFTTLYNKVTLCEHQPFGRTFARSAIL